MSEFDYQTATLAARHAGLWIAAAHVVVGLLQTAVVAWGIRAMMRAGAERAAAAQREAARADQRHAEAMQARADAMRAADARHAENMEALKAQSRALEALIERTAPPGADRRTRAQRTAARLLERELRRRRAIGPRCFRRNFAAKIPRRGRLRAPRRARAAPTWRLPARLPPWRKRYAFGPALLAASGGGRPVAGAPPSSAAGFFRRARKNG